MDDLQLQQHAQQQAAIHAQQQAVQQQQHVQQHAAMEQHANQQRAVQQVHMPMQTAYEQFYHHLRPLPAVPVAQVQQPVEAAPKTKEQKRREKQEAERIQKENEQEYSRINKELTAHPRLVDEAELRNMYVFRQRSTREKWAQQKLPHYKLTREETLRRIMDEGDYSNFENLDVLMRNVVANREWKRFLAEYHIVNEEGNIAVNAQAICQQLKEQGNGVSGLMNPALRLALSLVQKSDATDGMKQFCRELDEAMSTEIMVETLTYQVDQDSQDRVSSYFRNRGVSNPRQKMEDAVTANKAQQIQIAKRLLLMQLSDFRKVTTSAGGGISSTLWDSSMAVALSHCSRVALTLPRTDAGDSNAEQQKIMWRSIMTIHGENAAQDNKRFSSTHSIERRSVNDAGDMSSKELKKKFNLIGQRGMNCAIGGLGNAGVSGKMILNDGSCGHFYSMYKEADEEHYGAMLMGIESDAAGVMNQMGHTHDMFATAEKASSLGGQRTDEIGNKYGGRQCDLTHMSAYDIRQWMMALEEKMQRWQSVNNGINSPEAVATMRMLAGRKMDAAGWAALRHTLNVQANVAEGFHL